MDVHVLDRIWQEEGTCFIPTIEGWSEPTPGKYKAVTYREGPSHSKSGAILKLDKSKPLDSQRDCYFCPVQFKGTTRSKPDVIETLNVLWADLDDADPRTMNPRPTIAWHSSVSHYQALWVLTEYLPTKEIEALNRALTYHVGADKGGWDLTQLLRVPGSCNFKYGRELYGQPCTLMWDDGMVWSVDRLREIVGSTKALVTPVTYLPDFMTIRKLTEDWRLNERTRKLLRATDAPLGERSDRLWELEKLLVEAGMPVTLIVDIIKLTVWNKFADRHEGDKQLLSETLKAEKDYRLKKTTKELVAPIVVDEPNPLRELLTFDAFVEQDIPAPEFMVEGFLQVASVGICAGEPKTMKSTLMLDMAVSVASGKPFLGIYKVKPNPVLYIQEENSEADIKRRFLRISYNRRVLVTTSIGFEPLPVPLYIMNNRGINLQDKADREFIDKAVEEQGIKLLILDPWYMMCGNLNENDAGEVGQILKYLSTLRNRFGCTVILVHHFKKGDASRGGQRMRGSSVFHSWIECGLYSELNKGKPGNIIMEREFRAFPTNTGLNIVFNTEETSSLDYDVQVHDVSDAYMARLKAGAVVEPDEESDPDMMSLGDIDAGLTEPKPIEKGKFTTRMLVKLIDTGSFSATECMKTYGITRPVLTATIKEAISKGIASLTGVVPAARVETSRHITSVRRAR